ncbi:MAG: hypothetical protein MUF51_01815 [Vicinamibacteria bacterium]|jgi:hypothetical protein|nr:hypothetical protein [Vicinamibacteria bacterium]
MISNLIRVLVTLPLAAALLVLALFATVMGGSAVAIATLAASAAALLVSVWIGWRAARRARGQSTGGSWSDHARRLAYALLAVGVVACATAFVANLIVSRPPLQAKVASLFLAHRAEYEQLREMVAADKLNSVIEGGAAYAREPFIFRPASALGIDAERERAYRRLMSAAGCMRIDIWNDTTVSFMVAGWGGANRGWRMGIVSSRMKPSRVVQSVDGQKPKEWIMSPIADDWYVALTW